jgi:hypothetical protein
MLGLYPFHCLDEIHFERSPTKKKNRFYKINDRHYNTLFKSSSDASVCSKRESNNGHCESQNEKYFRENVNTSYGDTRLT